MFKVMASLLMFHTLFMFAQDEPKPTVSDAPLSAEQVDIYRAVLKDYTKGSDDALNIANVTDIFYEKNQKCLHGIELPAKSLVHHLNRDVALNSKMVFVDPDHQSQVVKKNDPSRAMNDAIENHKPLSDKELESSVNQAFTTGLFTFSEIVFNKQHTRAIVQYSFVCGGLCGQGNTLILKKAEGKWKISQRCGGWISFLQERRARSSGLAVC